MRKYILMLIIALPAISFAQKANEINWMTFEQVVQAQKKNPRKVMVDVYTPWCGWCHKLDQSTFINPDVVKYINENMYAVKFNAEGPDPVVINGKTYSNPGYNPASKSRNSTHELASYFGVRGYPNLVYLNSDMTVLMPVAGFKTPPQLEFFLKFFTDDVYKTVKTQEEFDAVYQKFVPTFQ